MIFSFGKAPVTNREGTVNILLVGIGGRGHEGQNLTDTIMIATINPEKNVVSLLSIPRDFYVKTTQTGNSKINAVYPVALKATPDNENQALEVLAKTVTSITDIPINYYIKIDFGGFITLIDAMGGVAVKYFINIEFDDFFFVVGLFELDRQNKLFEFADIGFFRT